MKCKKNFAAAKKFRRILRAGTFGLFPVSMPKIKLYILTAASLSSVLLGLLFLPSAF